MGRLAHPAFALQRFDQDAGGRGTDRLLHGIDIVERHLVETVHRRTVPLEIFRRAGGGQSRQRAAMESALEGNHAIAFRMAFGGVIPAHHFDGALHGLGAGIGEEDEIGKALLAQPRRQPLAVRRLEQVRDVPEFCRLRLKRCNEMRMAMAERVHGNAAGEIEIASAIGTDQPRALAALERKIGSCENGQQMRRRGCGHDGLPVDGWSGLIRSRCGDRSTVGSGNATCRLSGRHVRVILGAPRSLSIFPLRAGDA